MKNPVPIGSICSLQNGRAFKPEEWSDTGTPIVRIQNLNDESKPFNYCPFDVEPRFHIKTGDLLFSWSGTPGTSFGAFFWNRGKGFLNQHIFRVDVDESRVSKDYLRHALNAQLPLIMGQAHGGVGLQHITKGKLEAVEVLLPPLPEQRRIAAILNQSEALRAKRREALAQLDELQQAIFIEMFGDPTTNPKGWQVVKLGSHTTKMGSGSTPTGGDAAYKESGISLIRSLNVHDGKFVYKNLAHIDEQQAAKLANVHVAANDVLLNITGASVARVCRAPADVLPARVNQHVMIIRPKPTINSAYLERLLLTPQMKLKLLQIGGAGATREAITKAQAEELPVICPPIELQSEFERRLLSLKGIQTNQSDSLDTLDDLFGSLQHRAFQGEL